MNVNTEISGLEEHVWFRAETLLDVTKWPVTAVKPHRRLWLVEDRYSGCFDFESSFQWPRHLSSSKIGIPMEKQMLCPSVHSAKQNDKATFQGLSGVM